MTISPGATRYADIARWTQLPNIPLSMILCVVPAPNSQRHLLCPGRYRIRVGVTAENLDLVEWIIDVNYDETVTAGIASLGTLSASVARA
jgi:hypothetical protein